MSNNQGGFTCALWCWGISFVGGILAAALLMVLGGWSFLQGVFGGFVLFLVAGALLSWILCRPLSKAGSGSAAGASSTGASAQTGAAAAAGGTTAAGAAAAAATSSVAAESSDAGTAAAAAGTSSAASGAASDASGSSSSDAGEIKPSTALAGEAELADRKGSWRYEGGDDASSGSDMASGSDGGGGASGAAAATSSDSGSAAASSDGAASGSVDYDGDGVQEGADEGTKPEMLAGPRDGGADNLKEIKGIGPKLEQLVNSMGVYHFDQIANWTADEVAWVNANLTGFKGRVTRDNWIDQAKILAAGGETEFSKKVEKGGVYDE